MKIGWIGLGAIGTQMVKRLLSGGFPVSIYDRGQGAEEVKALGASAIPDYCALAAASDLVILCVFNDAQVRDILFTQGTLNAMRPGAIVAIHTTGSPALAKEIAAAAPVGVSVLDATFSGGPQDVAAGTLTLMVGGDPAAFETARPAFATYAGQSHHLGGVGSGQVVKLLNNLLFATNLMNAANILELAEAHGFDTATLAEIIGTCSGASYAMARFQSPMPIAAQLDRVRPYLEKDVSTAMAAARASNLEVEAFASTAEYFRAKG